MTDRTIAVRLRAEISDFKRQMDEAAKASKKVGEETEQQSKKADTALGRLTQSATTNRESWDRAGTTLTAFGAATVGALGAATKAAIDWESQWTGVAKTVSGTDAQLSQVEEGLRELARTMPVTHQEIAATAEAAGQLGVATGSIVSFTKTMLQLGSTTNLSADEAATSIAQLMNVMGTAPDEVDNLGASLVALGNNGASTERDIIQMAQRIAGSGAIIGLTEGQVMGLANALASAGIEVEAGGSAMSNIMIDIDKAVSSNSDELTSWAQVAGMTATDFANAWQADPADALATMVEGLGSMNAAGQDVFSTLDALGQSDVRVTRALLSMANSGDMLRKSLELGDDAWAANTALVAEAEKRYDTAAAKAQISWNSIRDSAITAGEAILPVVANMSEAVAGIINLFARLPDPVQQTTATMGGVVGVAALAAGGFLTLFPRVIETAQAFRTLQADGSKIPGMMTGIAKGAGVATAALVGFQLITAVAEGLAGANNDLTLSAARATEALLSMQKASDLDSSFTGLGIGADKVDGLADALARVASPNLMNRVQDVGGKVRDFLGGKGTTARTQTLDQIKALGEGLATMVSAGSAEDAAAQFELLRDQWIAAGGDADELITLMPAYQDALAAASNEQELASGSGAALAGALDTTSEAAQAAAEAMAAWRDSVAAADGSFVDLGGAYQGVIDATIAWAQSQADSTQDASDSWETYYDGVAVSADDYIAQLQAQVTAQENWEANILTLSARVRDGMTGDMRTAGEQMIDELMNLGPEGAAQVELLKNMTDEQLAQVVALWSQKGTDAVTEYVNQVEAYRSPVINVMADVYGAQSAVDGFITSNTGRKIMVTVGATGDLTYRVAGTSVEFRADGGAVFGRGTETSDSILSLLSNNEHVWSAAEVRGAGGHSAVERMRQSARTGSLPAFRDGGPVGTAVDPAYYRQPGTTAHTAAPRTYNVNVASRAEVTGSDMVRALRAAEALEPAW